VAGVAAPADDRRTPPVLVQVARGVGWTALLLATLLIGLLLVTKPGRANGFGPQWEAIAIVGAVVVGTVLVVRRLRRWPARPRWLVPSVFVLVVVAALPAFAWFDRNDEGISGISCVPLVDAWHEVVPAASSSDMAVWTGLERVFTPLSSDPVLRQAAIEQERAEIISVRATPAYQRADRYVLWNTSQDSCAPRSRDRLLLSAGLLAGGALLLTGATVVATRRSSRFRSEWPGSGQTAGSRG
jgi:hypothetical protein